MYAFQSSTSTPNLARMERPDESVNEKVFKRVVKTFGERPGELAHSKPEVFCDAGAFHPSPIQGKHKACAEQRNVLHFRVSFDMGREERPRKLQSVN